MERKFNPSYYPTSAVVDSSNELLTVYLHNLSGQLVGYQQYNPLSNDKRTVNPKEARYFTYVTKGQTGIWGLENLDPHKRICFVVEGIFKASILHLLGYNAIALLTSSPSKSMLNQMFAMPYLFIGLGDPDKAGEKLVRSIKRGFTTPVDADEMSPRELYKLCMRELARLGVPPKILR